MRDQRQGIDRLAIRLRVQRPGQRPGRSFLPCSLPSFLIEEQQLVMIRTGRFLQESNYLRCWQGYGRRGTAAPTEFRLANMLRGNALALCSHGGRSGTEVPL